MRLDYFCVLSIGCMIKIESYFKIRDFKKLPFEDRYIFPICIFMNCIIMSVSDYNNKNISVSYYYSSTRLFENYVRQIQLSDHSPCPLVRAEYLSCNCYFSSACYVCFLFPFLISIYSFLLLYKFCVCIYMYIY